MFDLSQYVRKRLDGLAGLRLTTPEHAELRGALTAFRLPSGVDPLVLRREFMGTFSYRSANHRAA